MKTKMKMPISSVGRSARTPHTKVSPSVVRSSCSADKKEISSFPVLGEQPSGIESPHSLPTRPSLRLNVKYSNFRSGRKSVGSGAKETRKNISKKKKSTQQLYRYRSYPSYSFTRPKKMSPLKILLGISLCMLTVQSGKCFGTCSNFWRRKTVSPCQACSKNFCGDCASTRTVLFGAMLHSQRFCHPCWETNKAAYEYKYCKSCRKPFGKDAMYACVGTCRTSFCDQCAPKRSVPAGDKTIEERFCHTCWQKYESDNPMCNGTCGNRFESQNMTWYRCLACPPDSKFCGECSSEKAGVGRFCNTCLNNQGTSEEETAAAANSAVPPQAAPVNTDEETSPKSIPQHEANDGMANGYSPLWGVNEIAQHEESSRELPSPFDMQAVYADHAQSGLQMSEVTPKWYVKTLTNCEECMLNPKETKPCQTCLDYIKKEFSEDVLTENSHSDAEFEENVQTLMKDCGVTRVQAEGMVDTAGNKRTITKIQEINTWIAYVGNARDVKAGGNCFYRVLSLYFMKEEYYYHWYRMKAMYFARELYVTTGKIDLGDGVDITAFFDSDADFHSDAGSRAGRIRNWYLDQCKEGKFIVPQTIPIVEKCFDLQINVVDCSRSPANVAAQSNFKSTQNRCLSMLLLNQHYACLGDLDEAGAERVAQLINSKGLDPFA